MKKTIQILLVFVLIAGLTASAQIQRGKKPAQTKPKTEKTSKNQKNNRSSSMKKENKQSSSYGRKAIKKSSQTVEDAGPKNEDVMKDSSKLKLTDPAKVWNFNSSSLKFYVYFSDKKISINSDQYVSVERVAAYLKSHPGSRCVIKGYAAPNEGLYDYANRLANNRAASIRDRLTNKCGIASDRIQAVGLGVSNEFDELSWNRVVCCDVEMNESSNPYAEHMNLIVHFDDNSTYVNNDQLIYVKHVAQYLNSHPETTCTIKGYAHPAERKRDHLADSRASSVMSLLVRKYGIASNRIISMGCGTSNMFDLLNWNSFVVCMINTD